MLLRARLLLLVSLLAGAFVAAAAYDDGRLFGPLLVGLVAVFVCWSVLRAAP